MRYFKHSEMENGIGQLVDFVVQFGERRSIVPPLNVIPVEELEEDWGVEREILWVWLQGRRHFWCSW